jgi:hypothetical protein
MYLIKVSGIPDEKKKTFFGTIWVWFPAAPASRGTTQNTEHSLTEKNFDTRK